MGSSWRLAVVGGDRREGEAAVWLAQRGYAVRTFACPLPAGWSSLQAPSLGEAVQGAQAWIGPVRGLDGSGRYGLWAGDVLALLPQGALAFLGRVPPEVNREAERLGIRLVRYEEDTAFAIANAIPTAEGAIAEAARLAGRTISGASVVVTGFGRVGEALAWRLHLWNAQVTVVARRLEVLAKAAGFGYGCAGPGDLPQVASRCDLAFNTVPAPVWTADALRALAEKPGAVLVDLASPPGGTDWGAAEALGVCAVLLPGIPGRWFPRTAGAILAETVERHLLASQIAVWAR